MSSLFLHFVLYHFSSWVNNPVVLFLIGVLMRVCLYMHEEGRKKKRKKRVEEEEGEEEEKEEEVTVHETPNNSSCIHIESP